MDIESHLPELQATATFHARRVARKLGLSRDDIEDMRQDLLVAMIERLERFDPQKASVATFLDLVARHGAHAAVRKCRRHQQMFGPMPVSFDEDAGLPDPPVSILTLASDAGPALDVVRTVAALPDSLRSLCGLLLSEPPSVACRKSRLSRATFYRRVRDIRLQFLSQGLRPAG